MAHTSADHIRQKHSSLVDRGWNLHLEPAWLTVSLLRRTHQSSPRRDATSPNARPSWQARRPTAERTSIMRESASEPLTTSSHSTDDGSGQSGPRSQSEALKTAIQIQVQVEALATTAQAAAKQARLLTQYVSTLGEVCSLHPHVESCALTRAMLGGRGARSGTHQGQGGEHRSRVRPEEGSRGERGLEVARAERAGDAGDGNGCL